MDRAQIKQAEGVLITGVNQTQLVECKNLFYHFKYP